jgi:large subunit ribosomal protein L25
VFVNEEDSPASSAAACSTSSATSSSWCAIADRIPDDITIDVTGLEIGDSIHISSVTLPEGSSSAITDRDFTIATIVAPSALRSEEGDTSTAAEAKAGSKLTSPLPLEGRGLGG